MVLEFFVSEINYIFFLKFVCVSCKLYMYIIYVDKEWVKNVKMWNFKCVFCIYGVVFKMSGN